MSSGVATKTAARERRLAFEAAARFAGLPQHGTTLGSASAPATLIGFADLQYPFCGRYGREVLPSVVDGYVRPGKLGLELNLLTFLGEDSVRAAEAAGSRTASGTSPTPSTRRRGRRTRAT